jgi:DnaJ like chaperone protein
MSWFGKLTFGAVGLLLGGPLGAIAGAALGHILIDRQGGLIKHEYYTERPEFVGTEQAQASYFVSLFSILGKLSKVDGRVSRDEIAVVQDFINSLPMDEAQKEFARRVFREAKDSPYAIEDFAAQLYRAVGRQPAVMMSFFSLLFHVAAADGTLHPAEEAALKSIQNIFRISDSRYEDIKAVYIKNEDKYYKILNCTPACSNEEIKANYKKLVKDFHPDKIIAKGLPEEFVDFASERFREIQESYEKIRKERHF